MPLYPSSTLWNGRLRPQHLGWQHLYVRAMGVEKRSRWRCSAHLPFPSWEQGLQVRWNTIYCVPACMNWADNTQLVTQTSPPWKLQHVWPSVFTKRRVYSCRRLSDITTLRPHGALALHGQPVVGQPGNCSREDKGLSLHLTIVCHLRLLRNKCPKIGYWTPQYLLLHPLSPSLLDQLLTNASYVEHSQGCTSAGMSSGFREEITWVAGRRITGSLSQY
jgi:hypothetical protein